MRSNNMNDNSEEAKRELLSRFMEFSGQTIACAYWYAKALSDYYGINIAERWETITQQKAALDFAYAQGRNDEAKRFNNADVRPVVLCRDCKYYYKDEDGYEMCENSEGYDHVTEDGFCAWAVKREEADGT